MVGVAVERGGVDRRAARIPEVEEAGDLVERLAGGVVDRLAEHPVAAVTLHLDQHRVAARDEQHDERELERRVLEERRVQVRLEVVDADERHVPRQRQRLGRRHADQQGADQTRDRTVQATASMRRSSIPASTIARAITGLSASRWARLAISGTTPPKSAWISIWLDTTLEIDVVAAHHERRRGLVAARLDAEHHRVGASTVTAHHRARLRRSSDRSALGVARLWMSWHHITIASSEFS